MLCFLVVDLIIGAMVVFPDGEGLGTAGNTVKRHDIFHHLVFAECLAVGQLGQCGMAQPVVFPVTFQQTCLTRGDPFNISTLLISDFDGGVVPALLYV